MFGAAIGGRGFETELALQTLRQPDHNFAAQPQSTARTLSVGPHPVRFLRKKVTTSVPGLGAADSVKRSCLNTRLSLLPTNAANAPFNKNT